MDCLYGRRDVHDGSSKSFRLWTFALMPFWRHLDLSCLHVDHSNIDQGRQSASRHPQIFMPFNLISTSFRSLLERIHFQVFIFCSFQYMIQALPHRDFGFHACEKKPYLGNILFGIQTRPVNKNLWVSEWSLETKYIVYFMLALHPRILQSENARPLRDDLNMPKETKHFQICRKRIVHLMSVIFRNPQ